MVGWSVVSCRDVDWLRDVEWAQWGEEGKMLNMGLLGEVLPQEHTQGMVFKMRFLICKKERAR